MSDTSLPRLSGFVFPEDRGPKNAATLNSVFTEIGTNPATVILTAGEWLIDADVTVPDNVTLILVRGAYFNIGAIDTLALGSCELQAPPVEIFTGSTNLTGTPVFAFRHPEWGSAVDYAIGAGYLELGDVDISAYIATPAEITNGTRDDVVVSPLGLANVVLSANTIPSHDNLRNVAADQHRRIHVSAGVPTGGQDGDVWIQYA